MSKGSGGLARLARLPARVRRDAWLFRQLKNWPEALAAEWKRRPLHRVRMRNGIVLDGPDAIELAFLFQETWLRRIYTPPGYEIQPGEIVIDIGANIGVFTIYAATFARDVKVFAYEPFPGNVEWLRHNIAESGLTNVQVHPVAVGAQTGRRHLRVADDWIMHSLISDNSESSGVAVECVSFDDLMSAEGITHCDLLKLDCEGSEYEILQGCAPDTLRRVRRIVCEYHEGGTLKGTGALLSRFLESNSFRIDRFERDDVEGCNLICATRLPNGNTSQKGDVHD